MHIVLVVYTVNMQDKKKAWHQQENHSPVFVHLWGHQFILCIYLNSYCERVVEQVKLDFPEVSWHQPGRNSTLNAADK